MPKWKKVVSLCDFLRLHFFYYESFIYYSLACRVKCVYDVGMVWPSEDESTKDNGPLASYFYNTYVLGYSFV